MPYKDPDACTAESAGYTCDRDMTEHVNRDHHIHYDREHDALWVMAPLDPYGSPLAREGYLLLVDHAVRYFFDRGSLLT